jgi:phosphoglycerate dehydrogenase-like enzyme
VSFGQNVALESADWSLLRDRADIAVFQNHLADPEAVIERLLPFDVVCVMRERTPLPRNVIERLPNLKLIASTGSVNGSMSAPRAIVGSQWFTRGIGRTRRSNLPGR